MSAQVPAEWHISRWSVCRHLGKTSQSQWEARFCLKAMGEQRGRGSVAGLGSWSGVLVAQGSNGVFRGGPKGFRVAGLQRL